MVSCWNGVLSCQTNIAGLLEGLFSLDPAILRIRDLETVRSDIHALVDFPFVGKLDAVPSSDGPAIRDFRCSAHTQ